MISAADYPRSIYEPDYPWNVEAIIPWVLFPDGFNQWCRDNAEGRWWPLGINRDIATVYFELEDDATLFAIRFGGKLLSTVAR